MSSQYDLYNKHGAKLCDAVGCRKHKNLKSAFRGHFCKKHLNIISAIRFNKGLMHDNNGELTWRREEMLLRKRFDANHVYYIIALEKSVGQRR